MNCERPWGGDVHCVRSQSHGKDGCSSTQSFDNKALRIHLTVALSPDVSSCGKAMGASPALGERCPGPPRAASSVAPHQLLGQALRTGRFFDPFAWEAVVVYRVVFLLILCKEISKVIDAGSWAQRSDGAYVGWRRFAYAVEHMRPSCICDPSVRVSLVGSDGGRGRGCPGPCPFL